MLLHVPKKCTLVMWAVAIAAAILGGHGVSIIGLKYSLLFIYSRSSFPLLPPHAPFSLLPYQYQVKAHHCSEGIALFDVCCGSPDQCDNECGGTGCSERPGGEDLCCIPHIVNNGILCQEVSDVGCIIPPSTPPHESLVTSGRNLVGTPNPPPIDEPTPEVPTPEVCYF